jgi:menaquinone-specific isochorismate synthase
MGPLAIGALPYDPGQPGWLTVPRVVLGRRGDSAWVTLVGKADEEVPAAGSRRVELALEETSAIPGDALGDDLPDGFKLSAMPHQQWKAVVQRAVAATASGSLTKVVVARRVDVVANRPFSLSESLVRLASLYPSCTVFHVEGFIGASPETLVRRLGNEVLSQPLAGTVERSGDAATDEALVARLMASAKDRHEHQVVVDEIARCLAPFCPSLEVPSGPSVVALRNVSHLATVMRGVLGERRPTSLELAAVLQPTPAVGGLPVAEALQWQRDNEGFSRGRYAGPVGWVDSRGDGEWALGLRSADISGSHAALYAGAGVVAASNPDAELAETQLKLQALLAALVRP